MPLLVTGITSLLGESKDEVISKALKKCNLKRSEVAKAEISKTSLDARKHKFMMVYNIYIELSDPQKELEIHKEIGATYVPVSEFNPTIATGNYRGRPVVVGFGPAGMFCALALAEHGYKPIVLERGESVDNRVRDVAEFWGGGKFNEHSNVQFGEGGAGTFSDGKLTTRIKDNLCRYVLERLVEFGAPEDILSKAKPHIGTDKLRGVVKNIRERIISLGGEIHFNSQMEDFTITNGEVVSVKAQDMEFSPCAMVLAVGHSARDTFATVESKGIMLQPKPFAVGVRIEHPQESINYSLYGRQADNPLLPVGEYQLSHRLADGRGVYTFCMCPGGYVVPASSEVGGVVTNGMSEYARDGKYANSAMVVSVSSKDYGDNPMDGVNFARWLERRAFELGGGNYKAPCTSVRGFFTNRAEIPSYVEPTYARGVTPCKLSKVFPNFITESLREGLSQFSRKMRCFGDDDAIMTAPETRTSSPIRILRNAKTLQSVSVDNLYPCGEGAGYAGGITSSAVDGLRVASALMAKYSPE
jgi:hypothetical protein